MKRHSGLESEMDMVVDEDDGQSRAAWHAMDVVDSERGCY
jgi:hypothetical protein